MWIWVLGKTKFTFQGFLKVFKVSYVLLLVIVLINRKDIQLTKLEARFSTSEAAVSMIQERIKSLELAMKMAKEVLRVPFLEQYCILDKVWIIFPSYINFTLSEQLYKCSNLLVISSLWILKVRDCKQMFLITKGLITELCYLCLIIRS